MKNLYYLLSFLVLFSCQIDELDQNIETLNDVSLKTRKTNDKKKNNGNDVKEDKEFKYVCHKLNIGNDWKFITLFLPTEAIQAHLDHGDSLGVCPNADDTDDADNSDTISDEIPSCECDGYVTQLDLRYNGATSALVTVTDIYGTIFFRGELYPGAFFVVYNDLEPNSTLGTEINISVDNEVMTTIDTSCSEPIGVGFTYGNFTVFGGSSRLGGDFCGQEAI